MAKDSKKPYGDVTYADPGYQKDGKKRYPIDTAEHVKAAWSYINQGDNASKYTSEQVAQIKGRIKSAAKKFGIQIGDSMNARPDLDGRIFVRSFDFEPSSDGGSDGRTLEGYAAVFNRQTRIADYGGDFDEVIRPGAFMRSISERKPVLQFDHGKDLRVGSVPIGVFKEIREDDHGLFVRARLFSNPVVEPVREAIAEGAITGMSFRFGVPKGGQRWTRGAGDDGADLREILETDTREAGPVVFPAYEDTSVSVRSLLAGMDQDERKALVRELVEELRAALAAEVTPTTSGIYVAGRRPVDTETTPASTNTSFSGQSDTRSADGADTDRDESQRDDQSDKKHNPKTRERILVLRNRGIL